MVPKPGPLSALQSGAGALSPGGQKPKPAKDVSHPGEWDRAVERALSQVSGHGFHHVSLGEWLPLCGTPFPHLQK